MYLLLYHLGPYILLPLTPYLTHTPLNDPLPASLADVAFQFYKISSQLSFSLNPAVSVKQPTNMVVRATQIFLLILS